MVDIADKLVRVNDSQAPISIQLDARLSLQNGLTASATLYLPDPAVRSPALVCLTVYGADFNHHWAMTNAAAGYAVAIIDLPGRGESEGHVAHLDDGRFGSEAIAWVAAQPWCDGRVAMFGGSYSGINQWATAMHAPAALAGIAPTVAPMPGLDDLSCGGLLRTYELRWAAHVHGRVTRRRLFEDQTFWRRLWFDHLVSGADFGKLGDRLGARIPFFDAAVAHIDDADYWEARAGTAADFAAITVPVLTITGTSDDAQRGAIAYHQRFLAGASPALAAASAIVIGPWNHAGDRAPRKRTGEPPCLDPAQDSDPVDWSDRLTLAWYDGLLRGGERPEAARAPANVFVCGTERWVHGASLDALADERLVLYPGAAQLLLAAADSGARSCVHDIHDFTLARFEASHPGADMFQTLSGGAPDDLAFTQVLEDRALAWESAALDQPLTIIGCPQLTLDLSIDGRDADIAMALIAVLPGDEILLSTDAVRLSRADDRWRDDFWPDDARRSLTFAMPGFIARTLPTGARLKLLVFGLTSLSYQANPHVAGPVTVTVHYGSGSMTRLELPVTTLAAENHA